MRSITYAVLICYLSSKVESLTKLFQFGATITGLDLNHISGAFDPSYIVFPLTDAMLRR
jgi:hypothetical protein